MDPGRDNQIRSEAGRTVEAIGRRPCPPLGEALCAVAAVWWPVDDDAVDARLDELARSLFGTPAEPAARAGALARLTAAQWAPDPASTRGLSIEWVLSEGRGHPVVIAAIAVELATRAGWSAAVASSPAAWYAALRDGERLWLIDPACATGRPCVPGTVRRHCAHELVFTVLTGMACRVSRPVDADLALALRDHLPLAPPARRPADDLLGALWSPRRDDAPRRSHDAESGWG